MGQTLVASLGCAVDAFEASLGVGGDLVDDHAQPPAVVGGGVEGRDEDRVERVGRPGQQRAALPDGCPPVAGPGFPGVADRT